MTARPPMKPADVVSDEYSDLTPVEAYLAAVAEDGNTQVHAIIHELDLETLRRNPEFRKAEDRAKAQFAKRLLDTLTDMALNGIPEELVHQGRTTGQTRRKMDPALLMRVIETYLPEFRAKKHTEVTHTKSGVQVEGLDVSKLSREDRQKMLALIEKGSSGEVADADFEVIDDDD